MDWLAGNEIVAAITYLLPGFLAAWLFFGLTAHPRREPFERVIQALIFTAFIQGLTIGMRVAMEWAGRMDTRLAFTWSDEIRVVVSFANAVALGLFFSVAANRDWFHSALRLVGVTKRTSYPSEWFNAFNRDKRYVVLHLDDGRRLYGWPEEWPDSPKCGHFVICHASWLSDDNQVIPIHSIEQILIPAKSVSLVERCKFQEEIKVSDAEQERVEKVAISLQEKELENGGQSTGPVPAKIAGFEGSNGQAHVAATAATSTTPSTQKVIPKKGRRNRR